MNSTKDLFSNKFLVFFLNEAREQVLVTWAAEQYSGVHYLWIGAIFNDLERPLNPHFKVTPITFAYLIHW